MSKNTATPAVSSFTFKFDGSTFTFTGKPLDVANKRRTVEAALAKVQAVADASERRTRKPNGTKVASEASIIRAWARENGVAVGKRGRLAPEVIAAFNAAQAS